MRSEVFERQPEAGGHDAFDGSGQALSFPHPLDQARRLEVQSALGAERGDAERASQLMDKKIDKLNEALRRVAVRFKCIERIMKHAGGEYVDVEEGGAAENEGRDA